MIKGGHSLKNLERLIEGQKGTPFEKRVWRVLLSIPSGTVKTYAWVARRIGHPKAYRAVGNALGKNPLAPLVPCHRVIARNGIGGYSGGIEKKKRLLEKEGVFL